MKSARAKPPRTRRKMQRVTMVDVARHADVSASTVSLYLRRPQAVSPAAGRAVAAAIEALDYVPNFVAGGLAAASSRAVSVIVPSVRNAFFAETVATMQTRLGQETLQVLLGHTEYSEREEEKLIRAALSWSPAALVLAGLAHSPATRKLLQSLSIPIVEIWELAEQAPIDMAVGFHHDRVGAAAAGHLMEGGRRRLVFLGARMQEDHRAARRARGFEAAVRAAGLEPSVINNPAPATVEVGGTLLIQALMQNPDVDAIACSNDYLALGVLFECQRRGIAVPGRIALVGFGDRDFTAASNPSLSTIRPPGELIGSEAARLIVERIAGNAENRGAVVNTHFTLLHRQSS